MPNVDINVRTRGAKAASSEMKKLGQQVKGAVQSLQSFTLAGLGLAGIVTSMKAMVEQGTKVRGVETAFKRVGVTIQELRTAVRGTVTDFELMRVAVQTQNLGIPISQLSTLMKFASIRARETGESIDFLVNSIVTGIGRKSILILDNLGISTIRMQEETKKLGSFTKAAFKVVQEELAKTGENVQFAGDEVARFTTKLNNLVDAFSAGGIGFWDAVFFELDRRYGSIVDKLTGWVTGFNAVAIAADKLEKARLKALDEIKFLEEEAAVRRAKELEDWIKLREEIEKTGLVEREITSMNTKFLDDHLNSIRKHGIGYEGMKKQVEKVNSKLGEQQQGLTNMAMGFANTMNANVVSALQNGVNLAQAFGDMMVQQILRIASTLASQTIIWSAFRLFGVALGSTGTLANFLGFQHGGSFRVGGQGGPDSVPVSFMASPGERVSVTNNINIHGSNQTQQLMRALNKYGRGVAS